MQPRILIFFALLLVIDVYSFQAVRHLTQDTGRTLRYVLYGLFWLVPVVAISYSLATMQGMTENWPRYLKVFLTSALFILYFSKFLIGAVLLIDDLRRVVMWIVSLFTSDTVYSQGRSDFMAKASVLLGSLPFISLTYGMIRNPYRYTVHSKDVGIAGLPDSLDGFKIVQISDIHSGSFMFKEPVQRSVEMINELKPDIAFFTGDLVNTKADEMDNYVDVFDKIDARHGVYSVLGNHDYGDYHEWPSVEEKEANFEYLKTQHKRMGWKLLMNEHRVVDVNGSRLGVIGVENYSTNGRFHKYGDLDVAMDGMESTDVNVLLSHDPSHWEEIVGNKQNINLTLSGHTHGFQFGVEIPGFIRWSPVQYVYRRWAGLYQEGSQYLYVNRGLGFIGYPGRVGILPEITLLTLRKTA